jgi:hypothetical protein
LTATTNITAFGTPEEAAATTTTPFDTFASQKELTALAAAWPTERLVEIWNSLAGVVAVKKFKSSKTAINRIWTSKRIAVNSQHPPQRRRSRKADLASGNLAAPSDDHQSGVDFHLVEIDHVAPEPRRMAGIS